MTFFEPNHCCKNCGRLRQDHDGLTAECPPRSLVYNDQAERELATFTGGLAGGFAGALAGIQLFKYLDNLPPAKPEASPDPKPKPKPKRKTKK